MAHVLGKRSAALSQADVTQGAPYGLTQLTQVINANRKTRILQPRGVIELIVIYRIDYSRKPGAQGVIHDAGAAVVNDQGVLADIELVIDKREAGEVSVSLTARSCRIAVREVKFACRQLRRQPTDDLGRSSFKNFRCVPKVTSMQGRPEATGGGAAAQGGV